MLLILVEVSVKVAYWSMTATDCSHTDASILLILVDRQSQTEGTELSP